MYICIYIHTHIQGEYKYANGAWYRGGWVRGNRQGRGVCTFEDGNLYEGEWENNLPQGQVSHECVCMM